MAACLLLAAASHVRAQGARYVSGEEGRGGFPLFAGGRAAALHVDSAEFAGVVRAAGDLQGDVRRVTGVEPALRVGGAPAGPVVLIGTLGRSPTIDALVLQITMVFTGLGLAWIYDRRGTVVASTAAHMAFNVVGLVTIIGLVR